MKFLCIDTDEVFELLIKKRNGKDWILQNSSEILSEFTKNLKYDNNNGFYITKSPEFQTVCNKLESHGFEKANIPQEDFLLDVYIIYYFDSITKTPYGSKDDIGF